MPDPSIAFEIDRIKNLIVNFDWTIEKQKISDDEIVLTIVKKKQVAAVDVDLGAS